MNAQAAQALRGARIVKLLALRQLCDLYGLTTGAPVVPAMAADLEHLRRTQGPALARAAVDCIASAENDGIQKAGAACLLDMLCPGWRPFHPDIVRKVVEGLRSLR